MFYCFFFFKQKTAYEMRISDWSADVCSSDLRDRRRIERHLSDARLPPGKTLDSFAFDAVPMVSRAQVTAITSGDGWLEKGANLILFGPPGGGKRDRKSVV